MTAWEVIEEPERAAEQLSDVLQRRRACVLLPWAHPSIVPGFRPPFDWEQAGGKPTSLGKRLLFRMLRRAPRFDPSEPIPGAAVRSVLLFRYDAIGDYIITTPLIRWLRQALPHARLTVLSSTRNDALIGQDPHVDQHFAIHPMHAAHPSWVRAIRRLRGEYDVVYALVFTHMSKAALLARGIAPGAEYVAPLHWERAQVYGHVFHRQSAHRPWREHWAEAIVRMGWETLAPSVPVEKSVRLYVPLEPSACERVWQWLAERGLHAQPPSGPLCWARNAPPAELQELPGMPYCVLNLSAYTRNRQWPLHHAMVVCRELERRLPGMAFVVTAAPSEWERVRALVELVGSPRWVEFRGTLFELIALVAGARWVLSPDTAVVHIAAALGKPVVGLYNELIKAAEWYPFGVPSVLAVSPALEGICFMPPGAVVEAVERLFGQVIPSGFVLPRTLLPTAEVSAAGASGRG